MVNSSLLTLTLKNIYIGPELYVCDVKNESTFPYMFGKA